MIVFITLSKQYTVESFIVSLCCDHQDDMMSAAREREREEELSQRTLVALNDMRIKFPGKTDEEAEYILDKVRTPGSLQSHLLLIEISESSVSSKLSSKLISVWNNGLGLQSC